ncbi:type IA DNA topoisomerase [Desulfospira joergensenii]|uniref:type IA DNA topoisomerase n=1 Tax=Desulfospira joergensenii TaxID=53329 RepID=UPI0003B64D82|nr:type IA DNA topoisomerase [Desulfospira joergensenii]
MKVVIAEKPSQGRDYAKVLGCTEKHNGYMNGNGYAVTWAIGHLVQMDRPEDMGRRDLMLSDLPIVPENWSFSVDPDKEKQFAVIESLINDPDTNEIICATDAGREGEHIFRLIYDQAGCTKPIKRLWISSLTEKAIKEGFNALKPGEDYDSLAAAAMCRAKADLLVGLNFSIAYSIHNSMKTTTGRVQTPTLAMVVQRELDIKNFKTNFYYEILAEAKDGFKAKYVNAEGKHGIEDQKAAEKIFESIKDVKSSQVIGKDVKENKQKAPSLYSLLTLQVDANKTFGLTAAQTLKIAQGLYETKKLISYPRTESNHLSSDMVDGLPDIVKSLPGLYESVKDSAMERIEDGLTLGKGYVDDKKLTDHHAIIPTGEAADIDSLTRDERNIFLLICERFVSIFLPDCITENTKVDLDIEGHTFRATGAVTKDLGWKAALQVNKAKEKVETLPALDDGQAVELKKMALEKKQTKPPARFNDASLLKQMKAAGKLVDDKELSQHMKENGIGTSATRGHIIEKLLTIGYMVREKKNFVPTQKGIDRILSEIDKLKSPELTGEWEQKLKLIEQGEYSPDDFNREISDFIKELMPQVAKSKKIERVSFGVCPVCGQGEIVEGSKGFGCTAYKDGCKFVVWKNRSGKTITSEMVKQLLANGRTGLITGFKSQEGKNFSAYLVLKEGKAVFESEKILCPECKKGHIFENKKAFGCSEYKEGCKFVIWKEIAGKTLTMAQVKQLIETGKTGYISGFTSSKGKSFSAYLVLRGGKIEFEFKENKRKGGGKAAKAQDKGDKTKKQRNKQRGAKR